MQITLGAPGGGFVPAENYFTVKGGGETLATAFVIPQKLPLLYPERPLRIFFNIEGKSAGRDAAFGAVLGRCQSICESTRLPAHIYTELRPDETEALNYYQAAGFDMRETLTTVYCQGLKTGVELPKGSDIRILPVPLTDGGENEFLSRLNQYILRPVQIKELQVYRSFPVFLALGLWVNGRLAGEVLCYGKEQQAKLIALYIHPDFRRHGLAKYFLNEAMVRLYNEGIRVFRGDVLPTKPEHVAMANAFQCYGAEVISYYPGKDLFLSPN